MSDRQKVRKERKFKGLTYQLDGTVDEVILRLQDLKDKTEEGTTLHLSFEKVFGQWGDDDTWEVKLYDERLETEKERLSRLQREEQSIVVARANKMVQLAQLKKELGED